MDFGKILETSLNEIYIFDAETLHFCEVNRGARENLGYTLAELQQMTPLNIKPEYTAETFNQLIAPLVEGYQDKIVFLTQHLRKDGTCYPVEVHLQLMQEDNQTVFVAIILDITQRVALQERTSELGRIFDASLNEIYVIDAKTLHFVEANHTARQNLGYEMDQLREMSVLDLTGFKLSALQDVLQPLIQSEVETLSIEIEHQRRDGSKYPVEVHLQQATLQSRPVFVAIVLDITERRAAAQSALELTMANQRAQLIRTFISDTSHEFRTSLTILGTKSYLLERQGLEPNQKRHVTSIKEHIDRLDKLVNTLQQSAVLEATDDDDIELMPVNINNLLQILVTEHSADCLQDNVNISMNLSPQMPDILADEQLIKSALFNILKNACDYNITNGTIDIQTAQHHQNISITVTDSGIGIAPNDLPKIFDPLFRADKSRNIRGGTGMGLSITKRIIELHTGTITVDSNADQGTTITISLPIDATTDNIPKRTPCSMSA